MTRLVLVSAAALFDDRERVLLAQRPAGKAMAGLWEFPGGKLEEGESPEAALARELEEELGLAVETAALKPMQFVSHRYEGFHLLLTVFACWNWRGRPDPREGQALAWVAKASLFDYAAPAADEPLFEFLASEEGCAWWRNGLRNSRPG